MGDNNVPAIRNGNTSGWAEVTPEDVVILKVEIQVKLFGVVGQRSDREFDFLGDGHFSGDGHRPEDGGGLFDGGPDDLDFCAEFALQFDEAAS